MTSATRTAITKLLYIIDDSTVAAHVRREHTIDCTTADVARVRADMPVKRRYGMGSGPVAA